MVDVVDSGLHSLAEKERACTTAVSDFAAVDRTVYEHAGIRLTILSRRLS
jgi:hypothetical protein